MTVGLCNNFLNTHPVTLADENKKYSLPLIEKEVLTHNSRRFRFGLPTPRHVFGVPLGLHFSLSAMIDGELVVRIYTPITTDDVKGYVDVIIKIYFKTEEYPNGGKMSLYLESLQIGDTIDFRGPIGKHRYNGKGKFAIKETKKGPTKKIKVKKINMIAGGTGITPMYQLIRNICQDPKDSTKIKLLYASKTEDDILLKKELDQFASTYPDQFQLWYTVGRSIYKDWTYSKGRMNQDMISERLFPPADDVIVLMCGPESLIEMTSKPALVNLGFKPERSIVF